MPWITDGGLNAIMRVDPVTKVIQVFPLPSGREGANLNTATFDQRGVLWLTGQSGIYGRLDLKTAKWKYSTPRKAGDRTALPPHLMARCTMRRSRAATSPALTPPPAPRP